MSFTNKEIQKNVNKINNGTLLVDGVIGTKTIWWVKAVQYAGGLVVDGIYGTKTHKYLTSIVDSTSTDTAHFSQKECDCNCGCGKTDMLIDVFILAEGIRREYDKPVTITSGRRCETYNTLVGGASSSQHLKGTALDIKISGVKPSAIYKIANIYNTKGGVGSYSTFTHIDCRGYNARW